MPYTSARLRSRTDASSPTTWSSMMARLRPTGSPGRLALMASRAARCPAAMPSAMASISSGSTRLAAR